MTLDEFKRTLMRRGAPKGLSASLQALWWVKKGAWDKAHALIMDEDGGDAAWVHAYLHRLEGDPDNARYWYRRARRKASTEPFEFEWENMVKQLLASTGR